MKIKRMILVAGLIVVFCLSALPAAALETVPVQDSLRVEPELGVECRHAVDLRQGDTQSFRDDRLYFNG